MGRYRRVPIAMVLSLFVRPSIHAHEPILCLVHGQLAVGEGSCGGGRDRSIRGAVRRRCRIEGVCVVVVMEGESVVDRQ